MTHEACIALLIDADNSPASKIDEILDELAKHGEINIRRAYGNWKNPALKGWEAVLHEYAIQPIQQFAYTRGKNATDAAMIIDAMDLLYTHKLSAFCLASSDSDFTPLVMRIRANGLKVFGFGERKTPDPFVNACSRFLYLETLGSIESEFNPPAETPEPIAAHPSVAPPPQSESASESKPAAPAVPVSPPKTDVAIAASPTQGSPAIRLTRPAAGQGLSPRQLRCDTRLVSLLRKAVEAGADDEGWANLAVVGSHISKQSSFDARNYGYTKLSELMLAIGLFEARKKDKAVLVRDKRKSVTPRSSQ